MAKQMAKISQGRVRDKRVTWFPELADKSKFMCEDVLISISLHAIGKSIKTPLLVYEELRGKGRPPEEPC